MTSIFFYLFPLGILETMVESDNGIELGKSAERALALSSAVGKSTIQPTWRQPWADL